MFYFFWFLFYDVIAQTMSRYCGSKFVWILGCNTSLWSTDRLPSDFGVKAMAKRSQFFKPFHRGLVGISLINFRSFCQNVGTLNVRESIKSSKDSYCSLQSKIILSHEIGSIVRLLGDDDVMRM